MKKIVVIHIIILCLALLSGCLNNNGENSEKIQATEVKNTQLLKNTPETTAIYTSSTVMESEKKALDLSTSYSDDTTFIKIIDFTEKDLRDESLECQNQTNLIIEDNEIYYIKNGALYKIDDNEYIIPIKITELEKLIDNNKCKYGFLYGICMISGQKYILYLANDYESLPDYYLVRYEDNVVIENYVGKPVGYFDDKILVETLNDEYEYSYGLFDVVRNEFNDLKEVKKYAEIYYVSEISFATESFYILELKNRENYSGVSDDGKYVIIDAYTYEEIGSIDFHEIDVIDPSLYLFKDNTFFIFDEGHSSIKTLNLLTGELKTNIKFSEKCKFIEYDYMDNSIYMYAYNYTHKEDEYLSRGYHQNIEACIDEDELETALQLYISYNLDSNEIKTINSIPTKEYIKGIDGDTCVKLIKDYKLGNFIFTYYNDLTTESHDYNIFSSKFKIDEEIDFNLWKK